MTTDHQRPVFILISDYSDQLPMTNAQCTLTTDHGPLTTNHSHLIKYRYLLNVIKNFHTTLRSTYSPLTVIHSLMTTDHWPLTGWRNFSPPSVWVYMRIQLSANGRLATLRIHTHQTHSHTHTTYYIHPIICTLHAPSSHPIICTLHAPSSHPRTHFPSI